MSEAVTGARFEVSRVLGQTFGLIGRNFFLFFVLSLLFAGLPYIGVSAAQFASIGQSGVPSWAVSLGGMLLLMLSMFVLQGALTDAAIADLTHKRITLGGALATGLRLMIPLLALGLLVTIGAFAGFLLLIVPGVILMIRWMVAAPVLVVEQHGATRAMERSGDLTRGHRWAIFFLALLYVIFAVITEITVNMLLSSLSFIGVGYYVAYLGVMAAVQTFQTMLTTVGVAAIYFELRRVKEGIGVDELASVFD